MISESLQHLDVTLQISITNCVFEKEAFVMKSRNRIAYCVYYKVLDNRNAYFSRALRDSTPNGSHLSHANYLIV